MSGGGTPRQQMIGLMYLVLLAMLAMNASKSLLNAFVMLEKGIDKTVISFAQANSTYYSTIDKAAASSPAYKKSADLAHEVKKAADDLVNQIADYKVALTSVGVLAGTADTAGGKLKDFLDDAGIPLAKDNQDFGAQYFMVNEGGKHGEDLVKGIDVFRDKVIEVLNNDGDESNDYLVERYTKLFDTEPKVDPLEPGGPPAPFAQRISAHLPLASVTANLSLWQSYIRNAEADVVSSIAAKMDGEGMVVDKAEGMVQYESGYVLKGDTVKGEVFLAAYNSKITPNIYVGVPDTNKFKQGGGVVKFPPGTPGVPPIIGESRKLPATGGGKALYSQVTEEVGPKVVQGVVEVVSAKGTFYYPYKSQYMVAEPTATLAASKMNVLYVGVDNPMQVSAPGVSVDELEISGPGISFRPDSKVPGGYIARASSPNPRGTKITVKKKDGTVLASPEFRVKRLPDPVATLLGEREGLMSLGKFKAASFIKAEMENFDFEAPVNVTSFKMTVSMGGDLKEFNANGATLTPAMKSMLSNLRRGWKVYFEEIKVKMPDGSTRSVPSIILKVN
jgi:gliding motility-associated protein GldM